MPAKSPKAKVHLGVTGSIFLGQKKKPDQFLTQCFPVPNSQLLCKIMSSPMNTTTLLNPRFKTAKHHHHPIFQLVPRIQATLSTNQDNNATILRRKIVTIMLTTSIAAMGMQGLRTTPQAMAENWGTHSFLWEKYFMPDLSPEDAAARIRQTAQGLHSLREMLEYQSWRYVFFYISEKHDYLARDTKNAIKTIPRDRWKSYVDKANELFTNLNEFDYYVRTPKVYESYVFYEKTLKSIDDLVALLS